MTNHDLVSLYNATSKHSQYQLLANRVRKLLPESAIHIVSRHEQERLDYICQHLDIQEKTLIDIGGNTGYFSIELLEKGAKQATLVEGNKEHADFVAESARLLDIESRLSVKNHYYDFNRDLEAARADIFLVLNVLHHIGDDYGTTDSIETAKKHITATLQRLATHCHQLVFQLGFNWKGNINLPLFANGTKQELIDFVSNATQGNWVIEHIGIACKNGDTIRYQELDETNIKRQDVLGEFLNRPLFIMRSLHT